jgi:hypothetical protein
MKGDSPMRWIPLTSSLLFVPPLLLSACAGGTRDVAAESHDVRVAQPAPGAPGGGEGGYVYVAKRPLGAVALAEARGIPDAMAARVIDHLADVLDACATNLGREGKLVDGAVRVVAQIAPDGSIAGLNVKTAPGAAVAANAILCVIAPLKLTSFPPAESDAGARGLAIEATWGSPAR